ncbi:hypothetical protein JCM14036_21540 [Desulfotomaculum defluvii]
MRSKWFVLFGIILALTLMAGPLAIGALAAGDHEDPQAGHDMSTMDSSDPHYGHDMSNIDSSSEHSQHDGAADGYNSAGSGTGHEGHESSGGSVHDTSGSSHDSGDNGGHDFGSGGHGGAPQDPNTPPNWPVIYGFGAFNLLVILAAALLKNKV